MSFNIRERGLGREYRLGIWMNSKMKTWSAKRKVTGRNPIISRWNITFGLEQRMSCMGRKRRTKRKLLEVEGSLGE